MMFNERHVFDTSGFLDRRSAIKKFFATIAKRTLDFDHEQYTKKNEEKIEQQALFFIDPNQSNQRLVKQQGLFLFPYTLDKQNHVELLDLNTKLIRINKEIREELQVYLDMIGINSYCLMPDLFSVCEAVERKIRDSRAKKSTLFKKTEKVLCEKC